MGVLRPRLHRRFTMLTRKTPAARIACTAAFIALALALVPAAFAGKGKPGGGGGHNSGGTSSLALVMVTDNNANGVPNWGDTITFNVSTTATAQPYVEVTCSQNGTVVYSAWAGFYDAYLWPGQRLMPLSSPAWVGGAADCTATLNTSLAVLKFHVDA
jgi:hypothetical protein